ncbi:hypothetical protein PHLGIDRAFT_292592 [Phlebiopsis gigantea 11061_1 CR5-6]|uniref:Uncharacterized protein n=1 Tax=Phlebiopsis gigantea (strain 11061_1 CR5-6) TaxID=745531 RepID=A0A0C3PBU6_PHLG1|nr:hypothetical protein PHLGIDRAFT_292592 [Phlebiopsis gigantea 11061_1 CR5-6]
MLPRQIVCASSRRTQVPAPCAAPLTRLQRHGTSIPRPQASDVIICGWCVLHELEEIFQESTRRRPRKPHLPVALVDDFSSVLDAGSVHECGVFVSCHPIPRCGLTQPRHVRLRPSPTQAFVQTFSYTMPKPREDASEKTIWTHIMNLGTIPGVESWM